jgi:signal transduction histidine kinase
MDASTLEHLWEPFYSTKGDRGTGLGLSTVYGIIQQSGGVIQTQSTSEAGSTFTFLLPCVSSPAPLAPEEPPVLGKAVLSER